MSNHFITYAIGISAQILFSLRMIIQWLKSEKAKKALTPEIFWQISLLASFLFFVYGHLRNDFAIMLGQTLTYFIYIRNMQLQNTWKKLPLLLRIFLYIFPLLIAYYSFHNNQMDFDRLFLNKEIPLTLLIWGTIGQLTFTFRFIYQWIYSEKIKKSKLPLGFWVISLTGSFMILTYAVIRKDPVLFFGQLFGFIIYIRNIYFIKKGK
jgi:lipid-A-disaccharide synthase-like uncharacterized protein